MNRLLISAAHKSSGKTTISLGICAALQARGMRVQPFKKGPDYIDPMWLGQAAGRPCHNLDFFLMGHDEIIATIAARAGGADIAIIEGNKGLYDGLDLDGSNSNAALAHLTGTPVVLVIDARGMTRGIAPLLLGYQRFDANIRIAGVILNRLGGSRHESKLRAVIEHYTDVPVVGAVHNNEALEIVERHLGLMPSNEDTAARTRIESIASVVVAQVDMDRLLGIAASAPTLGVTEAAGSFTPSISGGESGEAVQARSSLPPSPSRGVWGGTVQEDVVHVQRPLTPSLSRRERGSDTESTVRLAIARDAAFGFYYPGDLEALRDAGAEITFFDSLQDARLPPCDALFIGGGFPEANMAQLEANAGLRNDIRTHIQEGLPAYVECGGLMYLTRSITWKGRRCEMAGVLPADTVMEDRPQGRGYVRLRETGQGPWIHTSAPAGEVLAHEFHYSRIENLPADTTFAYEVLRGFGADGKHDGIVYRNLLASYTHLRDLASNHWAQRFIDFARNCKRRNLDDKTH